MTDETSRPGQGTRLITMDGGRERALTDMGTPIVIPESSHPTLLKKPAIEIAPRGRRLRRRRPPASAGGLNPPASAQADARPACSVGTGWPSSHTLQCVGIWPLLSKTVRWLVSESDDPEKVFKGLAHELGHPICAIQGWARLLQESAIDGQAAAEQIHKITESVELLRDAVLDYLTARDAAGLTEEKDAST